MHPNVARDLVANLTNLGFRVKSLRSAIHQSKRDEIVQAFNDPSSDIDVLVTGFNLSSFGVNLQHACSKGIICQFHWNVSTMLQGIGRIARIGQKHPVDFRIIKTPRSFMEFQEQRFTRKWVRQVLAESRIPASVKGEARTMVAYEICREIFGQRFNRFA